VPEKNSFEERLRKAQGRHGGKAPPSQSGPTPPNALGIGFRAGVEVVSALIAGIGLGWLLDRLFGTWPWLFLLFFVFGGVAGVLNVYRLFTPRRAARDTQDPPTG
jgi:ATP synthase protein I